jgi:MFS family permease
LRTLAIVILLAVNILNYYDRQAPGSLAEPIRKDFGLTDTQLGLLSSAFTLVYALVGVPIGRLGDRWSRRKLLALGLGVWSALTALAALASSYPLLLGSRLGVAIGEAAAAPIGTSWIGDLFPPEKRARAMSMFMLGVPLGSALSLFTSGAMADAWGWRVAIALAAAPALVLIPALFLIPEPVRGSAEPAAAEEGSLAKILRTPTFWWIVVSGALFTFNMYAIGQFMPAFFGRIHHLSAGRSGVAMGICQLAGGVGGALLAGRWGDSAAIRARTDGRMRLAAVIALSGAPASCAAFLLPAGSLVLALVLFLYAYGALNAYYGLVFSALHDIVPPSLRATAMAVYLLLMYLGGASFGPLLIGSLSDRFARQAAAGAAVLTEANKAAGLQQALFVIPVLSVALAGALYAGSRTITRDAGDPERASR